MSDPTELTTAGDASVQQESQELRAAARAACELAEATVTRTSASMLRFETLRSRAHRSEP